MNGCFRSTVVILIAVPALVLGLLAVGLLFSGDSVLRGAGLVLGLLALVGLVVAARRFAVKRPAESPFAPPQVHFPAARGSTTRNRYEQFRWGNPPPTAKQFGYALSLGVSVADGMTKDFISEEIGRALGHREPATEKQLRTIARLHGVLPRQVTKTEADDVIEFLEDHDFACPFCGETIFAGDGTGSCIGCGKSLKDVRIPIELPKR